jgi:hypothetical protein
LTIISDSKNDAPVGSVWAPRRTKPKHKKAEIGWTGVISNCVGGDEVWIYSDRENRYKAVVSWVNKDDTAMVRLVGGLREQNLRWLPSDTKVQWVRVRPK